ncbi:MAG: hypothetical protein AAGU74_06855 [Bacillota bacterium]
MKAKNAAVLVLSAAAIGFIAAENCLFNVNGERISEMLKTGDSSIVKIVKAIETSEKTVVLNQVVLSDRQKEMLILFLENTKFRRTFSRAMPFNEVERTIITAATAQKNMFFRLESYGGEYAVVDSTLRFSPANHWKLRIKNDRWDRFIDEILEL